MPSLMNKEHYHPFLVLFHHKNRCYWCNGTHKVLNNQIRVEIICRRMSTTIMWHSQTASKILRLHCNFGNNDRKFVRIISNYWMIFFNFFRKRAKNWLSRIMLMNKSLNKFIHHMALRPCSIKVH